MQPFPLCIQEYKTYKENFLKRFQLTKLPPYLIFCIKRFTKNNFFVEKNPTIVNFPITYVNYKNGTKLVLGFFFFNRSNIYFLFRANMKLFMLTFQLLPQQRRPFWVPHRGSSSYREEYFLWPCCKHCAWWKTNGRVLQNTCPASCKLLLFTFNITGWN